MTISRLRKIFHKRKPAQEFKAIVIAQDEQKIHYDIIKSRLRHYEQHDKDETPQKRVAWTWLGV